VDRIVSVRNYRDNDLDQCRGLWRELAKWHRKIYGDVSIGGEKPELFFDKHLAKVGASQIWVAVAEDRVVGFTGLEIENEEAKIEPVIVSETHKQKGIGRMLVEKAMHEAQKKGVKFLSVMPVARNEEAIRFFYEMGFRNIGQVQLLMNFPNKKWRSGLELYGLKFDL
jgi:N-acetylglutamate synthase-like GNAT family acetyltransferase